MTRGRILACLAALAACVACKKDPTGLMLILDVDPMLREMMRNQGAQNLRIAVTYQGRMAPQIQPVTVRSWPATVGVELQSADRDVLIEAQLMLGGGTTSIVGRALVTPAEEKVLAVQISFWGMCSVPDRVTTIAETDCRYPRLTGNMVLANAVQASINRSAMNVRQIANEPVVHSCGMNGMCPAEPAIPPVEEYRDALAASCEAGARRPTCTMGPLPDGGAMNMTDGATPADAPRPADAPPAADAPTPAEDRPEPPTDAPAPSDGGVLPDVVLPLDVL